MYLLQLYKMIVETVMVNNSSNTNKTSNHHLPQLIEHKKEPLHMTMAWDTHNIWQG